jgi:hypothetical protein
MQLASIKKAEETHIWFIEHTASNPMLLFTWNYLHLEDNLDNILLLVHLVFSPVNLFFFSSSMLHLWFVALNVSLINFLSTT